MSEASETTLVASIAGAIVEAVRDGLSRSLTTQPQGRSMPAFSGPPLYEGVGTSASAYQRASSVTSVRREVLSRFNESRKRYATPSMFLLKRSCKRESQPRSIAYVRDIFCLPLECQGPSGTVMILRGSRRSALANEDVGLMGKIEFLSDWSPDRMCREVCSVFSKAFGLTSEDIAGGKLISFWLPAAYWG